MTDILEVTDLEVTYQRSIRALHGVNLRVAKGQITALLGANGAGKSTTLRAISGFIGLDNARVTAGNVRYLGEDITGLQLPKTIHKGIVLVPERDKVFTNLTVAENLEVVSTTRAEGSNWRQIEEEIFVCFPRLAKLRNKPAGLLSWGRASDAGDWQRACLQAEPVAGRRTVAGAGDLVRLTPRRAGHGAPPHGGRRGRPACGGG